MIVRERRERAHVSPSMRTTAIWTSVIEVRNLMLDADEMFVKAFDTDDPGDTLAWLLAGIGRSLQAIAASNLAALEDEAHASGPPGGAVQADLRYVGDKAAAAQRRARAITS